MWTGLLYSSISLIIMLLIIAAIFYLINMKNMKKQKQHFKEIHQNLKVNDSVIILNAIYGKVSAIGKETVDIKIKSGETLEVSRYAISKINN